MKSSVRELPIRKIVMQPATACNLDCSYCYLPGRNVRNVMSIDVASEVADYLGQLDASTPIHLIWHGGEPLLAGRKHLASLLDPFEQYRARELVFHGLQTNATLIDDDWCKLFKEYGVEVGVSIDGDEVANIERVDWQGAPAFNRIRRGIAKLREHNIEFSVISVVTKNSIRRPEALVSALREIAPHSVGINIEEAEGVNTRDVPGFDSVTEFWLGVYREWLRQPSIRIREIANTMAWLRMIIDDSVDPFDESPSVDLFPTVAWNGDVVLLSPELLGVESDEYQNFVVGNVLESSFSEIVRKGRTSAYVSEFRLGIENCLGSCKYFSYCGGGQASNKYFEHGTFDCTRTTYCENTQIRLFDAILKVMENE